MSLLDVRDINLSPPRGYLPAQEEARAMLEDPDGPKWVLLSGGQGAGKSYWLVYEALRMQFTNVMWVKEHCRCSHPRTMHLDGGGRCLAPMCACRARTPGTANDIWTLVLSPTNVLLKKGLAIALEDILVDLRVEYRWNKQDGLLRFAMGGGFYTFTAENPDRIIAATVSCAVYDEPGTPKDNAALRRIPGRMRGPGILRKVAMAGTPEDIITRPEFYDFIASPEAVAKWGAKGDNSRRIVYASTRDNVMIPDLEGYVEEQTAVLTKAQVLAYVEGQFVAFNVGRVYAAFIDRRIENGGHRIPLLDSDGVKHPLLNPPGRGNELYISLDFNVDPMCGVIAVHYQPEGKESGIRVLDEIVIPAAGREEGETPIGAWCREAIARWVAEWNGPVRVFGDATAERMNVAASRTGWTLVHDALRPIVQAKGLDYMVGVWGENPREIDRVNSVNAAFERGEIVISEGCMGLRRDLNVVGFKPGTTQIDKETDKKATHLSDALGYLWVQLKGVLSARAVGPLPPVAMHSVPAIGEMFDWPTG